jgi:alpha-glucosidase
MLPIYQALAKLRKENPALTSGSMRFLRSDAESIVYVRESAKQAVVVCVTRNSKSPVRIPKDAVPGLAKAINIYGGGAIKTFGNQLELPAGKLTANIWSLL